MYRLIDLTLRNQWFLLLEFFLSKFFYKCLFKKFINKNKSRKNFLKFSNKIVIQIEPNLKIILKKIKTKT